MYLVSVYVGNGTCSNDEDSTVQLPIKQKLSRPCNYYIFCRCGADQIPIPSMYYSPNLPVDF